MELGYEHRKELKKQSKILFENEGNYLQFARENNISKSTLYRYVNKKQQTLYILLKGG